MSFPIDVSRFGFEGTSTTIDSGTAPPTSGTHALGDWRFNSSPGANGPAGWICITGGTPGTWLPRGQAPDGYFNITDYGAVADGTTDCSPALTAALAAIPNAISPDNDARTAGGGVVYLPANPDPNLPYFFATEVTVPIVKNVVIRGAGPKATRVTTTSGVNYWLYRDAPVGVFYQFHVENIQLHKCGVRIDSQSRNDHEFNHVFFKSTPDYALVLQSIDRQMGSQGSVIGGWIKDCEFNDCYGGIRCEGNQSDNWKITHCKFVRQQQCDIQLYTSGWRIRDCYFEQRDTAAGDLTQPFINVAGTTGNIRITGCRFGNEVSGSNMPPRESIVVGTLGASETGHVLGVLITGNTFRGRGGGGPTSTSSNSAIRFNVGASNTIIRNNNFSAYNSQLIEFAHANTDHGRNNQAADHPESDTPLFSVEPTQGMMGGWYVSGRRLPKANPKQRETVQLLKRNNVIHNLTGWAHNNATTALDAVGPDGLANSAYTLTKPVTGSSTIATNPTALTTDADLCVSAWFKKGSGVDVARLYINSILDLSQLITLTDQWVQYWFWFPAATSTYTFTIAAGAVGDTQTGTILFANPQVEMGRTPTEWLPRETITARSRPGGWRQIGINIEGQGTAPPTTGNFLAGDRLINLDTVANPTTAWVCSVGGNPGTWVFENTLPTTTTETSLYTVAFDNELVLADATSGGFTVNLPPVAGNAGLTATVKKIDSSVNAVTVDADGAETIDGSTTFVLTTQNQSVTLRCDGTEWWVL